MVVEVRADEQNNKQQKKKSNVQDRHDLKPGNGIRRNECRCK